MRFEKKVELLRIQKHKGKETDTFLSDVIKMAKGEELEFLLGEVLFCGAKIDLSFFPMIPRPETEHWVKQAIEGIQNSKRLFVLRALDLFSGSGNIGLAIAVNIPEAIIDMIEVDPKLKSQIDLSILKNNIKRTRTHVLTGDTWEGASGLYDVITAVPPYVPPQMKEEVMKDLSAESPLFFFDKEDGFYYHKQVLCKAKDFLNPGGVLYLEFDITQREKIEELVKEYGFIKYSFLNDPYGHEYVVVISL